MTFVQSVTPNGTLLFSNNPRRTRLQTSRRHGVSRVLLVVVRVTGHLNETAATAGDHAATVFHGGAAPVRFHVITAATALLVLLLVVAAAVTERPVGGRNLVPVSHAAAQIGARDRQYEKDNVGSHQEHVQDGETISENQYRHKTEHEFVERAARFVLRFSKGCDGHGGEGCQRNWLSAPRETHAGDQLRGEHGNAKDGHPKGALCDNVAT